MIREAGPEEKIEPAPYVFRRTFMAQEHNYYCAVCRENMAVIDCSTGILQPCWDCMARGYYVRKKNWIEWLFAWTAGGRDGSEK